MSMKKERDLQNGGPKYVALSNTDGVNVNTLKLLVYDPHGS